MRSSMEVWATAVTRAEEWGKQWETSIKRILAKYSVDHSADDSLQLDDPINILKRLQRESFYELMKLRERQEKLERILAMNKSLKGSPFGENVGPTHMKGIFSVNSSLPFLNIAGIRTAVESRFNFQTVTREKDTLIAEFTSCQQNPSVHVSNMTANPLTLSKVAYLANINDWLSLVSVPFGAQCQDFGFNSQALKGLMVNSSFYPQFLLQSLGCAAGLRLNTSNISITAAQSLSSHFGSFGQVGLQLFDGVRISLVGLRISSLETELSSSGQGAVSSGALVLESEIDECSQIRGWVELLNSSLRSSEQSFRWGLSLSDTPEGEMGWGLAIRGTRNDNLERLLGFESFLNIGIGKRLILQPGVTYTVGGRTRSPALVFISRWTL